jgi:branched-chain amino acid aminotransferase
MADHLEYLVMDGAVVRYDDARIHITSPAVRYGATAFEGVRAYWSEDEQELYLFRAPEHVDRLLQSARLMGMEPVEHSADDVLRLIIELLHANGLRQGVHIRPSLFVAGEGSIQARGPVSLGIVAVPSGAIIDTGGWETRPFRLAVSSWRRIDDNSMPPRIKCAANYQNARMALIQAEDDGYDGALMLDAAGHVTEEARGCVFAVRGGAALTPPVTNDILESITRDTVTRLLREVHGVEVVEREIDRTELYVADEVFLCGTALGVTPVGSVDRFAIGGGAPGPVTAALNETYVAVTSGRDKSRGEWLTPVYGR